MAQGKLLDRVSEIANRPVIKILAKAAAEAVRDKVKDAGVTPPAPTKLQDQIAETLATKPEVLNETNQEVPRASRTATGAVHATIASSVSLILGVLQLFAVVPTIEPAWLGYVMVFFGVTGTGGGIFALWGRFKEGLPPMTRKWYNPFSWFAPGKLADTV